MRTRMMIALVLALAMTGIAAADDTAPLGREVARDGRLTSISGTLAHRSDEWFLDAQRESYELHMGPYGHDESLPFTSGDDAVVHGFFVPKHIAPITVATGGETYRFWSEDRYPLWAGSGALRNSVSENGQDLGFEREEEDEAVNGDRVVSGAEPGFRNRDLRPGQGR